MTPKQKAEQIFDLYFEEMLSFGFYLHNSQINRLALIAVDEIIRHTYIGKAKSKNDDNSFEYWQEVKQEIEAL